MTNPDMMTNMVKQGVGGFLPQVKPDVCYGAYALAQQTWSPIRVQGL